MLRERAGMTVAEAADTAGVSESYLASVEAGSVDASPEWMGMVAGAIAEAMRVRAIKDQADSPAEAVAS